MRTVTYKSVIDGVLRRRGNAPSNATTEELERAGEAIADRLLTAWEYYTWPETMGVEQRYYRDTWASGVYASGAEVYYSAGDAYYQASTSITTEEPGVDSEWVLLTTFRRYVAYEQTGQTAIDAVIGVWDRDPRSDQQALGVSYEVTEDGINIPPYFDEQTYVWMRYRSRCPDFRWDYVWDASTAYAAGKVVYVPASEEVYIIQTTTTAGDTPATASAKFGSPLEFPFRLARAVKAGARADLLGATGNEDKEAGVEGNFIDLLEDQVWQLTKLQGQTGTPRTTPPA